MEQLNDSWILILPLVFVLMLPILAFIWWLEDKKDRKEMETNPKYWIWRNFGGKTK